MNDLTVQSVAEAVARANAAMAHLEQTLNEADAKLGDGDTGGMLSRVIRKMADVKLAEPGTVGGALTQLAKAATLATGSSLGTLIATGLLAAGRQTKEAETVAAAEFAALLRQALEAMTARGGASLGDKTVLDSLDAMARALDGVTSLDEARAAAVEASSRVLDEFRQKPNRIGRARMFGDQTIGIDDPGMLAVSKLTQAIAD